MAITTISNSTYEGFDPGADPSKEPSWLNSVHRGGRNIPNPLQGEQSQIPEEYDIDGDIDHAPPPSEYTLSDESQPDNRYGSRDETPIPTSETESISDLGVMNKVRSVLGLGKLPETWENASFLRSVVLENLLREGNADKLTSTQREFLETHEELEIRLVSGELFTLSPEALEKTLTDMVIHVLKTPLDKWLPHFEKFAEVQDKALSAWEDPESPYYGTVDELEVALLRDHIDTIFKTSKSYANEKVMEEDSDYDEVVNTDQIPEDVIDLSDEPVGLDPETDTNDEENSEAAYDTTNFDMSDTSVVTEDTGSTIPTPGDVINQADQSQPPESTEPEVPDLTRYGSMTINPQGQEDQIPVPA